MIILFAGLEKRVPKRNEIYFEKYLLFLFCLSLKLSHFSKFRFVLIDWSQIANRQHFFLYIPKYGAYHITGYVMQCCNAKIKN